MRTLGVLIGLGVVAGHLGLRQPSAEQYIRDGEREWAEATATGDTSVAVRIVASDFVGVDPDNGRLYGKAEAIASIRDHHSEYASSGLDEMKVRVLGNTAIAQGSESWERRSGEPRRGRYIWTDTWMLRDGSWQIVAAQDLNAPPLAAAAQANPAIQTKFMPGLWQAVVDSNLRTGQVDSIAKHRTVWFITTQHDWIYLWVDRGRTVVTPAQLAAMSPEERRRANDAKIYDSTGANRVWGSAGHYEIRDGRFVYDQVMSIEPVQDHMHSFDKIVSLDSTTYSYDGAPNKNGVVIRTIYRRVD
jgi:ketosteroid isomerase-like protein